MGNFFKDLHTLGNVGMEEKYRKFFGDDVTADIVASKAKIEELTRQLEEAKNALEGEYSKMYSSQYVPEEWIFHYKGRGQEAWYSAEGVKIENAPEGILQVDLDTKNGDTHVVAGYSFEIGSIVVRKYKYSIPTDSSKCNLQVMGEVLVPFYGNDQYFWRNEFTTDNRWYATGESLRLTNATNFLNGMYGTNHTNLEVSLYDAMKFYGRNKAFEIVIRTAPDSLVKLLISEQMTEAVPVNKILGISQELYNLVLDKGVEVEYYNIREMVKDKEVFHKTPEEWLDMLVESFDKEHDLEFFHIDKAPYRYNHRPRGGLIEFLAVTYRGDERLKKYYSFGKFFDYVVEETVNQGYTAVKHFVDELIDYLRMCDAQGIVPTLYSSYLQQTHDIAARNHKIFLDEHQEEVFSNRYKDFKALKFGDYTVSAPKTSDDIKKEGDALNHCVASYIKRVLEGETLIYFLRKEEGVSLVTLEVKNGRICQARGMHNRRPSEAEYEAIHAFAKKNGLEVSC